MIENYQYSNNKIDIPIDVFIGTDENIGPKDVSRWYAASIADVTIK